MTTGKMDLEMGDLVATMEVLNDELADLQEKQQEVCLPALMVIGSSGFKEIIIGDACLWGDQNDDRRNMDQDDPLPESLESCVRRRLVQIGEALVKVGKGEA